MSGNSRNKQLFTAVVDCGPHDIPRPDYGRNQDAWKNLQDTLLGKTILFTDRDDWADEQVEQLANIREVAVLLPGSEAPSPKASTVLNDRNAIQTAMLEVLELDRLQSA